MVDVHEGFRDVARDKITITMANPAPKRKWRHKTAGGLYKFNKDLCDAVKADCGCLDCGESDPVTLVYHHIDPSIKGGQISKLVTGPTGKLLSEMSKCIVLCCNCHAKRHHNPIH